MSASEYRTRARQNLRGSWPTAVIVCLVAAILGGLSASEVKINFNLESLKNPVMIFSPLPPQIQHLLAGVIGVALPLLLGFSLLYQLIRLVIGGAVSLGFCRYQLNLARKQDARFEDLFSCMNRFGAALCMYLLSAIAIALGTLAFVIPGLILSYGLSFAGYIMAEDPECSAMDALKRSWQLTRGHKMELFLLDLSFIGWAILAALTFGIGTLFLNPYVHAARTAFYLNVTDPMARRSVDNGYDTVDSDYRTVN